MLLFIISILLITCIYPMENKENRSESFSLEDTKNSAFMTWLSEQYNKQNIPVVISIVDDIIIEESSSQLPHQLSVIANEELKTYELNAYTNAPKEAFYQAECPSCNKYFKKASSRALAKDITKHIKKKSCKACDDVTKPIDTITWHIKEPTISYYVRKICPFYKKPKKSNHRCLYFKESIVAIKSFTDQCNLLEEHLVKGHNQVAKGSDILEHKHLRNFIGYKILTTNQGEEKENDTEIKQPKKHRTCH